MKEKVYINSEFQETLKNLNCGYSEDYITINRYENDKVFFQYGKCKFHVTKAELDSYRIKAD
jgi:hypothetical protein